ncbi:hypothetical protein [Yoonia tamlensis]|nr:hypothetical protein [Yoonia tamlensis]
MQTVEFKRSDGLVLAGLGVVFIAAACVGVVMLAFMARIYDAKTIILTALGFLGACALGVGFINAWRTPMLTISASAIVKPTFFGRKEIAIRKNHPLGEYLASSVHGSRRTGTIEGNKFVHFYTLDAGVLTELVSMHRDAPVLVDIRRAFRDVAGLTIETLKVDANKPSRPDVAHWMH